MLNINIELLLLFVTHTLSLQWCLNGNTIECYTTDFIYQNLTLQVKNSKIKYINCTFLKYVEIYFVEQRKAITIFLNYTYFNLKYIDNKYNNTAFNISNYIDNNNGTTNIMQQRKNSMTCNGLAVDNCLECFPTWVGCALCEQGYTLMYRTVNSQKEYTCTYGTTIPSGYYKRCNDNWKYNESTGRCCAINCSSETCSASFTNPCATCASPYKLVGYSCYYNGCTVANCETCSSSGVCSTCKSEYTFKNSSYCEKNSITIPNCATYRGTSCTKCESNYYLLNSTFCQLCDTTCGGSCSDSTGYCSSCSTGLVYTNPQSNQCEVCSNYDSKCVECLTPNRECRMCTDGYYPTSTNSNCISCDSTCASTGCNTQTGACGTCVSNQYTIISETSVTCQTCSSFDSNCVECSTISRKCTKCTSGMYPSTTSPFTCVSCDSTCLNGCNTQTGYCEICSSQYTPAITQPSKFCSSCNSIDPNCNTCSSTERKCLSCASPYFVGNNGANCVQCDSSCSSCDANGYCTSCASNYVMYDTQNTKCQSCADFDSNCETCPGGNEKKCTTCKTTNMYPSPDTGKCISCSTTCGGSCDQTDGHCTSCDSGLVFTNPPSTVCEVCKNFDSHCATCADNGVRSCLICSVGYYPSSGMCVSCTATCQQNECNAANGICTKCIDNHVVTSPISTNCESCSVYDQNCVTCATDFTRKCIACKPNYYIKMSGDYKCQSCSSTCGGACNGSNGFCTTCSSGMVPTNPPSTTCITCQAFDVNCESCVTDERKCIKCSTPNMYPDDTSRTCVSCSTTCGGSCDATNGICTTCQDNFVFQSTKSRVCEQCSTFDEHCNKCSSAFDRKCVMCNNGYYPNENGVCVPCGQNCNSCDESTGACSSCSTNNVFSESDNKTCMTCSSFDVLCLTCSSSFERKCAKCLTGSYLSNGPKCTLCDTTCDTNYCNNQSGICSKCSQPQYVVTSPQSTRCVNCNVFDTNCMECKGDYSSRLCVRCASGMYPSSSGSCVSCSSTCGGQCNTINGECTGCQTNYVFSDPKGLTCQMCYDFDSKCTTCSSDFSRKCVVCNDGYYVVDGKCKVCDESCGGKCDTTSGHCTGCDTNKVFSTTNSSVCIACADFDAYCRVCASSGERKCNTCTNKTHPDETGKCVPCDAQCTTGCNGQTGVCVNCNSNEVIDESDGTTRCEACSSFDSNCNLCASDQSRACEECNTNYYPDTSTDFKCKICDATCNGSCNTRNGYCTGCLSNYVFISSMSLTCQSCRTFDSHCATCSPDFSRKCVTCDSGYYPSNGICVACSTMCQQKKCNISNGMCTLCIDNYVVTSPFSTNCIMCSAWNKDCVTCATNFTQKCVKCKNGKFASNGKCQDCDSTCGGACDGVSGHCTGCTATYVPSNTNLSVCISCQVFDMNCESCVTDERKCIKCSTPNMYPDDTSRTCVSCSTTCGGSCDATNGICTTCQDNFVFQSTKSRVCEQCSTFDAHCAKCSSAFDRKCVMCNNGYYPDEIGVCVQCSTINTNCTSCSQTVKKCLACKDPQYLTLNGICSNCEIGTYKKTETTCESCYFATENCNVCSTYSVAVSNCTSCMTNFVLNGGECQLCPSGKYYNPNSKNCQNNDVNCQIQVDESTCLLCNINCFLANGVCQQTTRCQSPSNTTMSSCDCYDQISVNSDCQDKMVNCKHQKVKREILFVLIATTTSL
ncbi:hypothetical protein EIN_339370 [Entamoeba invadens IP1]|uniref:Protein serine/threonine kinase n=1 Tax=Entamoeba invadens IP1 TaxID=370355 RepID=A0A0A1U779_ENTIV|nr:hypothetical protein EIN_339370 [Entamoeba invadens IP1]ELP90256.1 hypothetical protein EIN_339370 [Entamoeba invadens IP1]|eukprot:XP_004257027.1 hypothetical protein EIN_339370 [Entamoeba invadens IP1]